MRAALVLSPRSFLTDLREQLRSSRSSKRTFTHALTGSARSGAQDAIAEIHLLTSHTRDYEWAVEADIVACFDTIDHTALMGRVRRQVGDKRVLALIKTFPKSGILTEAGSSDATETSVGRRAGPGTCQPNRV